MNRNRFGLQVEISDSCIFIASLLIVFVLVRITVLSIEIHTRDRLISILCDDLNTQLHSCLNTNYIDVCPVGNNVCLNEQTSWQECTKNFYEKLIRFG